MPLFILFSLLEFGNKVAEAVRELPFLEFMFEMPIVVAEWWVNILAWNFGEIWAVSRIIPHNLSGAIGLLTRVTVESKDSLDPRDPFRTPFQLTNAGPLPVFDIHFTCEYNTVILPDGKIINNLRSFQAIQNTKEFVPNDALTFFCGFPSEPSIPTYADIRVRVIYRPVFWLFEKELQFRFATFPDKNGTLKWLRRSLTSSCGTVNHSSDSGNSQKFLGKQ